MNTQNPRLGSCPHCGASITEHHVHIEYETKLGKTAFAECPDCEAVVNPAIG